ncbi:MAG: T9SS type A sorting domain-containing protein [Bacteroidota bacterium]
MKYFYSFLLLLFISINVHAQATDFITGLNDPQDMLLDGNMLYVIEADSNRIIKIDLSDPNPVPEIVISSLPVMRGLALHGTDLYFSQLNGQNKISRIDLLDPNPTPEIILEDFTSAQDLIFYGDELYIAKFGSHKIVKIDPSIPNPPIIDVVTDFETPIAMELVGDDLYVATYVSDKISKIDLTDPNPAAVDVVSNLLLPVGLVHRGNELYIAEAGQSIGQDRVSKIDITSSNPTRITVVDGLYNPTKGMEIYDNVLYFSENFKISSFGLPPLSIDDFASEKITVHPNPSSDFIEISGLTEPVNYKVYSVSGAVLETGVVAENENINVQSLSAGTYFLVLDGRETVKIVKK